MKYKTFRINIFEQEPGKWRARITRAHRRPLKATKELGQFAANVDHSSAVEAMTRAMEMVDAASFSRCIERTTEKRWRCLRKADRKLGAV
jgi:hypothetical protein